METIPFLQDSTRMGVGSILLETDTVPLTSENQDLSFGQDCRFTWQQCLLGQSDTKLTQVEMLLTVWYYPSAARLLSLIPPAQ